MPTSDWIIVVGVAAAMPVWGYAVFNQWSNRSGAMGRMVGGCAPFVAIIAISMLAAYLASSGGSTLGDPS
jgi:hypothetical protein